MARPKKDTRSQLQIAADRVRKITAAVEVSQANLKECQADVEEKALALKEARRDHDDTASLLKAQQEKLDREIQAVRDIVGPNFLDQAMRLRTNDDCPY